MYKPRRRNRKLGFDYSSEAIYFVTICCKDRVHFFGRITNGEMNLNESGQIVNRQIKWLEEQYSYCHIHNAVVMPNHVHILLEIGKSENQDVKVKSLSSLIGAFKTTVSKHIHLIGKDKFAWQRSFHDHIVKSETRYQIIFNYISENPGKWDKDKFY